MEKSRKLYLRALETYNSGKIEKALKYCDKSIGINIKNSAALNLKGLILYIKGDLLSAQGVWKTNYNLNNDLVSQKYIKDTLDDTKLYDIYISALENIDELKINEALELLLACKKSDFNSLNVDNSIAYCYLKIGDYDSALEYINKVLKIDSNNMTAKENIKLIKDYNYIKTSKKNNKVIFISTASIGIVLIASILINLGIKSNLFKKNTKQDSKLKVAIGDSKNEAKNQNLVLKEAAVIFPYEEIKKSIDDEELNKLYDFMLIWQDKTSNTNDKILISKAADLLSSKGVKYFYDEGIKLVEVKDYKNALVTLQKAYNLGEKSYLFQHILYFMGTCSENVEDQESAIKYYEKYDKLFENGNYESTVLYNISIIYNNLNDKKAKEYAEKLLKLYPQSIYNNEKINSIINRKYD